MTQAQPLPIKGTITARTSDWTQGERPGEQIRALINDPTGFQTMVMKIASGPLGEMHAHDEIEQIYVMDGDFFDDDASYQAGDLVVRMPGTMHRAGSTNGATLLITYLPYVRAS